jgi:hypothetical protein
VPVTDVTEARKSENNNMIIKMNKKSFTKVTEACKAGNFIMMLDMKFL